MTREETCNWLQANGLDPRRVPLRSDIRIENFDGPSITVDYYKRDDHGNPVLNRSDPEWPFSERETRTVPLIVQPPSPTHV
jgi:hypothetical protein